MLISGFKNFIGGMYGWLSAFLKQMTASYCSLQTADSSTVLVSHDGALVSVFRIGGIISLVGSQEFERTQAQLQTMFQTSMSQAGHYLQVCFGYNNEVIRGDIKDIFSYARQTGKTVGLELSDLFEEREKYLSRFCAREEVYLVVWTTQKTLTSTHLKRAQKDKRRMIKKENVPPFVSTQNIIAAIPDLREAHDSFTRLILDDFDNMGIVSDLLEVHEACRVIRSSIDPDFTDKKWNPLLPGDKITVKQGRAMTGEVSDVLWPSLSRQLMPRDAEVQDLRTVRIGDQVYSCVYIDLFPQEVQPFVRLFQRLLHANIPWRISFGIESDGLKSTAFKKILSSVLTFTSSQNRLINDSLKALNYLNLNTDDAVVKLRVVLSTWAPEGDKRLLRVRSSMLAKAVQSWGSCDVSEVSGDPYEGALSTAIGLNCGGLGTPSVAPLSDVLRMLPFFRPASIWKNGAILFRSPDGKPWPYHPGSRLQTTWIDLFYARPGSGKSVLSNAMNLAVCLSPGLVRLPRISVIDIGPSSSGLILLLKDSLPLKFKHLVAYHRLRMHSDYAINPFDTQLGCRFPTPQERAFLVNFLTLLVTPVGSELAYDGAADMAGLVVDELYKSFADDGNPKVYQKGMDEIVDGVLDEIGFVADAQTTWWEVTDAVFGAGFVHEAMLSQRYGMPILSDVAAICRISAIQDLYGKIITPTSEDLIHAFARMVSGAVREYPIISQVTQFDLGDARVVALDLDEVARTGGDAANRQTSVMYMLARYVLARHYFLTDDNVHDMPDLYKDYHATRITEIREDPKRIVFDEFHRTAHAQAVRDQVIQDMREGRKWKVQVALLSQSIEDFDSVMVEFATSIFIMDAGPEQSIKKTAEVFGLNETAQLALRTQVHGPREGGATFLAQFATKQGISTQLLTSTLGPVELWSLTTTAEDVFIRNHLYQRIGAKEARRVLSYMFPGGSAQKLVEELYAELKDEGVTLNTDAKDGVLTRVVEDIVSNYYRRKEKDAAKQ